MPSSTPDSDIRSEVCSMILDILRKRGPGKTCCPSEIPRKLFPREWREYMELTRCVTWELVREDVLEVCQKGEVVTKESIKGPIRLRLKKCQDYVIN